MDFFPTDKEQVRYLYREPLFDRSLEDLRKKRGHALQAARKAEAFIELFTGMQEGVGREKFRYTRKGEYRIKDCRKIDLGCGYRLICIQKEERLALLYVGSHDECTRWLHRRRGLEYKPAEKAGVLRRINRPPGPANGDNLPQDVLREQRMLEEYEAALLSRIDDSMLREIFSGLCGKEPARDVLETENS